MVIFLQCQFQKLKSYSIKKSGSSGIMLLAGLFFIASIFFSGTTFAQVAFSGGSLSPANSTICAGNAKTLSFTGSNVTDPSGGPWSANYQWDSSSDGTTWLPIAGASGVITTAAPTTTYTTPALFVTTLYRVEVTDITVSVVGPDYTSNTATVNVIPVPAPITGNFNVCKGTTNCLTDATSGGIWSTSDIAVATVGTGGCVIAIAVDTVTIAYTDIGGCSVVAVVTINATAPVGGPSSVCVGSMITLTDATAGVTWSSSNTLIATVGSSSGIVTGVANGTVTIIATSPLGCQAIATINVNPDPPAINGATNVCLNSVNCLTDGTFGGTWSSSNSAVASIATTGCVTGNSVGSATITYTLPFTGCFNTITVSVNPSPDAISGAASVCVGLTTSLSNATAGGTFSSLNTAVATTTGAGVVTGISSGTATIVYTSSIGCTVSVIVTVNPLAPITGSLNVCNGFTTQLTDAATGGTWSASNTNAAVNTSGLVSGSTVGIDTIIYTLPFGCIATASVTINPQPSAITGTTDVCVGGTTSLTDAGGGTWSSSSAAATVDEFSGVVTGANPGTATISYTLSGGCIATIIVTVNAIDAISGPGSVCLGSIITFSDAAAGGTWSSSNPAVGTIDVSSGGFDGISSGTTILSYSSGANCYVTLPVTVNVITAIQGPSTVCPGLTITLSNTTAGGTWTSSNTIIASVDPSSGVVTGNESGTVTITYTVPSGCIATTTVTVDIVYPITGNTSLCPGTTTDLTNSTIGGTWSSGNVTVATVGTDGVVTASTINTGTANITYTIPDGCAVVVTITVNPLPAPITGPAQVCVENTITLSDLTSDGIWSSTEVDIDESGDISAVSAGVASITYELLTGCSTYYSVTVNPLPDNIYGTLAICQGLTTTLNDPSTGGAWTSSNTTITTIGSSSGLVNGISSGADTIIYTLPTGCSTDTAFLVNPLPAAINGVATICFGLTTDLTDVTIGGTWSSSNTTIATVGSSTGIVTGTGAAGGTATITYMLSTGCINTITVTVNPQPTAIFGPNNVCVGQTITLTDITGSGIWSSSNTAVATIGSSTGIVTGQGAGTTTITYALVTGCMVTTAITVNALSPVTGNQMVCVGLTTDLSDAASGGTWSSSNTTIATVNVTGIVTGNTAGTDTIIYILPSGCTATLSVTVSPLPSAISGSLIVCVGQITSLSDGIVGGTWTSSNTGVATIGSSTGLVTGIASGTSIMAYTLGTGCFITAIVTVNPLAPIMGNSAICEGLTSTFSDAVTGTWSSSNTAIVTIDPSAGVATGISDGTATISFITGTGCTATLTVTVNAIAPISGADNICAGVSTIFTDSVTGGIWSSSNTAVASVTEVTGVVTGNEDGTATISYVTPSGCVTTLILTVNSLGAINGSSSVCQGGSISLTDATSGGIWSSSDSTTASVSSSGNVNGNNSGTAIISYAYGPACVVVKAISVEPSTPIGGNFMVCLGLTTTLTDSTLGGAWSSSNANVSLDPTGIIGGYETVAVTGNNTGLATISYTLPSGCLQTAVVTVNMTAAITGPDSVCIGLTTTLADATAGVTWTSNNNSTATITSSGVVTGVSADTVTITATSPVGCIATVVVTIDPLPSAILGAPVVCVGLTTSLSDTTGAGTWSSSNTGIATVNSSGTVTGIFAGTVIITYTLPTGCYNTIEVTVDPLPGAISGPLNVCIASSITLTDAGGGTWTASNTNATIGLTTGIVTGAVAGLDTITYTVGTGCIMTAVITINPLPDLILGNFNICINNTNILSDGTVGGTWSSSNGNATIGAVIGLTAQVIGNILGNATITYMLSATGCYVTQQVTVDAPPLPVTGADSVCVGLITQLSDATFGGTWSSNNTGIATVGSGNGDVMGLTGGSIDTIVYSLGTGCSAIAIVTVNPLPDSIRGNFILCIGTSNTLTDLSSGGAWSSSNTNAAIDPYTGIVTGVSLGTATITYTLNTGCIIIQQITVDPVPSPIPGPDSVCVGSTAQLLDITGGGIWTSSDTSIATVDTTTGVVSGISAGTSIITYQLTATGCVATTIITVDPLPGSIDGPNTVCVADSIKLLEYSLGGSWTTSDSTIATIGGLAVTDSTDIVEIIGQGVGGVVNITYTLPTGCLAVRSITVYPLPPAIIGPDSICVNSLVTLSDSSVGGTWSSSLVAIANVTNETGIVSGISPGTTTISYQSNEGCYTYMLMTVNPVPTPIYPANGVCFGLTVQLSDSSPGGVWSTTNSAIDTISATGMVDGLSIGLDSILYTYPVTGCSAYLPFTVHPIPVITASTSNGQQICLGVAVTLTASGAGTNGTYAWTPPVGLSNTNKDTTTAFPSVTTVYTVVGTTQYGCASDTTVAVYVDSLLLNIHILGRDSICQGAYDTLTVGPTYIGAPEFTWWPIDGLSATHADTVYANPIITTIYTATLIDSFGCQDSTTFTLTVNPSPIITVLPNPGIVCRGTPTTFTANGAGAGGSYAWYPNAFLTCDSCQVTTASDTQNLVYEVYGTSEFGCRDSIAFPVSVLDTTRITISGDTSLCVGQCANLLVTSTSVDGSHPDYYQWSPATGLNDPDIPNPTACPDTTTDYTVIVKENACFYDTSHVIVFAEPYPAITITTSTTGPQLAGSAVQLNATITNGALLTDYEWTPPGDLSCQKCYDPIATPTNTTTYTFTATSNYGCVSTDTVSISLLCGGGQVFIPNTFTPGCNCLNARFFISGKGIGTITRFSIYNRWGELMFQSTNTNANDPGAGWDGTYKGVVLEPDVFVYVAQVTCELGGTPFNFQGNVALIR